MKCLSRSEFKNITEQGSIELIVLGLLAALVLLLAMPVLDITDDYPSTPAPQATVLSAEVSHNE